MEHYVLLRIILIVQIIKKNIVKGINLAAVAAPLEKAAARLKKRAADIVKLQAPPEAPSWEGPNTYAASNSRPQTHLRRADPESHPHWGHSETP